MRLRQPSIRTGSGQLQRMKYRESSMTCFLRSAGLLLLVALSTPAGAQGRYSEPPPVVVSPDLSAPWVMQLRNTQRIVPPQRQVVPQPVQPGTAVQPVAATQQMRRQSQPPQVTGRRPKDYSHIQLDPRFLPQEVKYDGPHPVGTIVVDTKQKFLYLITAPGKARRYGVGVGKEGFAWKGVQKITAKREWPDWRPPAEMIERERRQGRILPVHMAGGPLNPLGARALYLGSTLYRIHGTNAPWTIGQAVSSGCIRMRNEDVIDLYERVKVGTTVVVI